MQIGLLLENRVFLKIGLKVRSVKVQIVQKLHVLSQGDEFLEEHNRGTGHESGGGCDGGSTVHVSFGFSRMSNDNVTMGIGNSISCSDRVF